MLALRGGCCPTVKLIALQERKEPISITIINNSVFTARSLRPEISLSTERGCLPVYLTGLKRCRFGPVFLTASPVRPQQACLYQGYLTQQAEPGSPPTAVVSCACFRG